MAIKVAYGSKDGILAAINAGGIPTGNFAVTKDSSEFFFYGTDGHLHQITQKDQFSSMEEANAWIHKYDCTGQIISIQSDDIWGAYIVENDNELTLIAGDAVVRTYKSHLEFPTVGVSNILYLATEENDGKGYIYHWVESRGSYEIPADTLTEDSVEVINGGGA